ncbi:MAG: SH3 domain-containing protein [Anaerolineae bacterium]|nr:SH3 domain-containing protein [Anaerolineae bacterium]
MKRFMIISGLLALAVAAGWAGAPTRSAAAQTGVTWSVEYYNNVNLLPPAVYTAQVPSVGIEWTPNGPAANVTADYFSARWTSVQTLSAGTYRVSAKADDGVRVIVDGTTLINEFHVSSGLTYTADVIVGAGQHTIVVDYYEGDGLAYLWFDMVQLGVTPTPVPSTATAIATVTASFLNVRDTPSAVNGAILTKIRGGETYAIVGRNADSSWWQLYVNGINGWASGRYLSVVNTQNVPITDGSTSVPITVMLTARLNLNMRSGPGLTYAVVGWLPVYQSADVIGRNAANTWWQITYGGVTGWVSGVYTNLQAGTNINQIPITDGSAAPTPGVISVTANLNLNMRSGPGVEYGVVGWLPGGTSAQVTGRNVANTWWQISYSGVTGWISGGYSTLQAGADVNQIPITWGTPTPAAIMLTAQLNLNMRSGPSVGYAVVGWLPVGQSAQVIGRSPTTGWWQITYNGVTGWVSGRYTALQAGIDANQIPITG